MTYTIERFTQGVWFPLHQHKTKELAEAELGILRSLLINGQPLHKREHLRIVTD